jgi:cytochrome c oxidase subunit 4
MQTTHTKHPNYVGVFIALGILTAIEVATSVYIPEPTRIPLLLIMAAAKGALVALYYMHLKFDSRIFSFFFGAAIFVLAIPFALVLLVMSQGH